MHKKWSETLLTENSLGRKTTLRNGNALFLNNQMKISNFALDIFHVPWTFSYRCSTLFLASNQHTNRRKWKKRKVLIPITLRYRLGLHGPTRVCSCLWDERGERANDRKKNAALTPSNQNCSVRHSNIWIVVVIVLANISVFGRFPFSLFHMSLFVCCFF